MNIVDKYAELSLAADSFTSAGMPVPFEIKQGLSHLESEARARLSPEQMADAMSHVEAAKTRILSEEQAAQDDATGRKADEVVQSMTAGMLRQSEGLTRSQLADVKDGKRLSVPQRVNILNRKSGNRTVREQTKRYDPAGKGYSMEQWERKLESLISMDDDRLKKQANEWGVSKDEVVHLKKDWQGNRLQYESDKRHAVAKKPKDDVIAPTDDEQRRAVVIDAYINTVDPNDRQQADTLMDGITDESLEDEGMRGDIAKAFAQSEEQDHAA